jgi:hypothetical protein
MAEWAVTHVLSMIHSSTAKREIGGLGCRGWSRSSE